MRDAAADRAAVADLVVRDMRDRGLQQRMRRGQPLVVENVAPAHHRAEPHAVGADLDAVAGPGASADRPAATAARCGTPSSASGSGRRPAASPRRRARRAAPPPRCSVAGQAYSKAAISWGAMQPSRLTLWNDAQGLLSPPTKDPSTQPDMQLRYGAAACRRMPRWRMRMALSTEHVRLQLRPHRGAVRRPRADRGLRRRRRSRWCRRSRSTAPSSSRSSTSPKISMSSYLLTVARNDAHYVAIPAFVSRLFRHSGIYIRTDRGIKTPAGPQGQDHRPAGIPDDRERLGARHAAGRIRRASRATSNGGAAGWRSRAARSAPRFRCRRRSTCRRCPTDRTLSDMLEKGEIDGAAQRAGADLLPARRAERRAAVPGLSGGRRRPISRRPGCSRSCMRSASAARWWRSIRGWR